MSDERWRSYEWPEREPAAASGTPAAEVEAFAEVGAPAEVGAFAEVEAPAEVEPPGTQLGEDGIPDGPIHPGSGRGSFLKRFGGPLAALALLATKAKGVLLLLPKLKLFTTSASMLVSIVAYQLIFGWPFAVGFVVLLLIHEMGHVIQLRREGIEASAPMFIPFLGAVISAKSMGEDAAAEARVGLAGPILGSIATLIPLALWAITGEDFWRALAYIGFFLNLFNLLPIVPLDGGRAMAALSPWVWGVGFAGLIMLTFVFPNPIMLLILLFGGMESWRRFKQRHSPESRAYHSIPARTRLAVGITYISLAAALAFGVSETYFERTLGDV